MKKKRKKRRLKTSVKITLRGILVIFILFGVWKLWDRNAPKEVQEVRQISVREQETIYEEAPVSLNAEMIKPKAELENTKSTKQSAVDKPDILLVNKENRLPEDYKVTLKTMPDRVNKAAKEAYEPLCDMLTAGRKEGLSFEICSSYRDVTRQQELFDEDLRALIRKGFTYQEAYEEVAKETMPPGHSEHSTGLAFDIVSMGYQILDEKQEDTLENIWLREHCAEYGFILRYPKGKEDITHINYESWHFRYVGKDVAKDIMEQGITLEEYLEQD